jgi:hypothetical protein
MSLSRTGTTATLFALAALAAGAHADDHERASRILEIADVEALYAAVNDPANQGATLRVAPGTYRLSPADARGAPRPNFGTLVLQRHMRLVGSNEYVDLDGDGVWDARDAAGEVFADPATETIIDASALTTLPDEDSGGARLTNIITLGLENRLEKVTVRNAPLAGALVGVTPQAGGERGLKAEIVDCIAERGWRGIRCGNRITSPPPPPLTDFSGTHSEVHVRGCIARHNRAAPRYGWGFQLQNALVKGGDWVATLVANRFYDNKIGLFGVAVSADDTRIIINSENNILEQNLVGSELQAGRDAAGKGYLPGGSGNALVFTSVGDRIRDNVGTAADDAKFGAGGILAAAGQRSPGNRSTSDGNDLQVSLYGTSFSKNYLGPDRRDVRAYAARNADPHAVAGKGNTVEILLSQVASDMAPDAFRFFDSVPAQTAGDGNLLTVLGSNVPYYYNGVVEPPSATTPDDE